MRITLLALVVLLGVLPAGADAEPTKSPREALHALNELIGPWRATGTPEGTREERQKGFWTESIDWSWKFKGDDAWLTASFEKGKYFIKAELRYLPAKDRY